MLFSLLFASLTLVSEGGLQEAPNSFRPDAQNKQPRGKIAPGTFQFIPPPILATTKKNRTYHLHGGRVSFQSWDVREVVVILWF